MPTNNSLLGTYSVDAAKGIDVQPVEQPQTIDNALGIDIAKTALEFEGALAEYLRCECKTLDKLLQSEKEEEIIPMLKVFKENIEQMCDVQARLVETMDRGLKLGISDD